jgi:hypothetical protein
MNDERDMVEPGLELVKTENPKEKNERRMRELESVLRLLRTVVKSPKNAQRPS